ncbi:outer membrane beta-barrel protein [Pedobacter sp. SYSU D00535]|uniref:outer membrane beta-barrel protein n=1 Tax=Pedobacter sp. SYSU D00535 TaxID=2810308 RepID=UPI001F6022F5|nr:outer membrane beta-barrel protein [Pedobacter sp. SYSU D00535]
MMKKVLLTLAIAASGLVASAQTEKGNVLLGGTIDYTSTKSHADGAEAANDLTILPVAGYFVGNNLAIGTGIGFSSQKAASGAKTNAFVVSPFGRYYKNLNEQFKFFGQLAVPMIFGSAEDSDGDDLGSTQTLGVSLSPGFAYFPSKKVGIELSFSGISFLDTTVKNSDGDKIEGAGASTFSIGADFFSPQIGLVFYF